MGAVASGSERAGALAQVCRSIRSGCSSEPARPALPGSTPACCSRPSTGSAGPSGGLEGAITAHERAIAAERLSGPPRAGR
jgi:hypothetical protein